MKVNSKFHRIFNETFIVLTPNPEFNRLLNEKEIKKLKKILTPLFHISNLTREYDYESEDDSESDSDSESSRSESDSESSHSDSDSVSNSEIKGL